MIQAAVERAAAHCPPEQIWIVTNEAQRAAIQALMPEFDAAQVITEPEARDTAACVGLAVATIAARDPSATLAILPADHLIAPIAEFRRMLARGAEIATDDETLVTFGVPPTFPATGYGYIALGAPLDDAEPRAFTADGFREKPDQATAEQFVNEGRYWWNSGIVVFSVRAMLNQMQRHCPTLSAATDEMLRAKADGDDDALASAFRNAPKVSIDYAVMEHADKLSVIECTANWDDVGDFPALARVLDADDRDNHCSLHDGATAELLESHGNVIFAEGARAVTMFGVDGLVVAAVGDAVMVCPKERADELKKLVEHLKARGREDLL